MSLIDPHKLRPNAANTIFDPLPEDVYAALKADIAARGLLNPILCTSDYTVIAGHHRLQAALELGLDQVPVDIQDVDASEAEDRLIADNVLRRQLSLMEQARLIKRLKERAGIKRGKNNSSRKLREELEPLGLSEDQADRLNRLNHLVPPLQALVSDGKLGTSHGVALAALDPEQQQALYEAIGEAVTQLKLADIQAAKKIPDTSELEASIAALETERERLQAELHHQPQSEAIVALTERLQAAEDAQQAAWAEVERLRAEKPIDRIVQTIAPDPGQARRIQDLEAQLAVFQPFAEQIEQHGTLQQEIKKLESEKTATKSQLHSLEGAIQRLNEITKQEPTAAGRIALTQFVRNARVRLRALRDEWETIAQLDPAPLVPQLQPEIRALLQILQELGDGLTTLPHRPTEDTPAPVVRPFGNTESD